LKSKSKDLRIPRIICQTAFNKVCPLDGGANGAGGYRRRDHDTHAVKVDGDCGVFGDGAGVGGAEFYLLQPN